MCFGILSYSFNSTYAGVLLLYLQCRGYKPDACLELPMKEAVQVLSGRPWTCRPSGRLAIFTRCYFSSLYSFVLHGGMMFGIRPPLWKFLCVCVCLKGDQLSRDLGFFDARSHGIFCVVTCFFGEQDWCGKI